MPSQAKKKQSISQRRIRGNRGANGPVANVEARAHMVGGIPHLAPLLQISLAFWMADNGMVRVQGWVKATHPMRAGSAWKPSAAAETRRGMTPCLLALEAPSGNEDGAAKAATISFVDSSEIQACGAAVSIPQAPCGGGHSGEGEELAKNSHADHGPLYCPVHAPRPPSGRGNRWHLPQRARPIFAWGGWSSACVEWKQQRGSE